MNQMRDMGEVPWPARRFKCPPTFGTDSKTAEVGQCPKQVAEAQIKSGRFLKRKKTVPVVCGGRLMVKRGNLARRRVYCEGCRTRKAQRKLSLRLEQQARRFGRADTREAVREERRSVRMLRRLRAGSR